MKADTRSDRQRMHMTITIMGATGHLGGLVVDALLARGQSASDIIAVGRDEARLVKTRRGTPGQLGRVGRVPAACRL